MGVLGCVTLLRDSVTGVSDPFPKIVSNPRLHHSDKMYKPVTSKLSSYSDHISAHISGNVYTY